MKTFQSIVFLSVCILTSAIAYSNRAATSDETAITLLAELKPQVLIGNLIDGLVDWSNVSSLCNKDLEVVAQLFKNQSTPAQKIYDAWGKPNPGVIQGAINWLGRSAECLHTRVVCDHCNVTNDEDYSTVINAEQRMIQITLTNVLVYDMHPQSFYGACFPKSCSNSDVLTIFGILLADIESLDVVEVYSEDSGKYDFVFGFAVFVFSALSLAVFVGTCLDYYIEYEKENSAVYNLLVNEEVSNGSAQNGDALNSTTEQDHQKRKPRLEKLMVSRMLLSFSLNRNVPKLLSMKSSEGSILCLNGIRVLSLGWVILGHTIYYLLQGYPNVMLYWNNYYYSYYYFDKFLFQICSNATLSVDSFFVLSAFLLTYLTLKKMETVAGRIRPKFWILFYVRRYVRLTPALALVILFTVGIWKVLGNNTVPRWQPMQDQVNDCAGGWWANLLYINNLYTNYECLGWTWYLANDFQFFAISPGLIVFMYKYPKLGYIPTVVLIVLSCIANFVVSWVNNFAPGSTSQLSNPEAGIVYKVDGLFDQLYVRPWNRFCSYGIGMLLGLLQFRMPSLGASARKWHIALGWLLYAAIATTTLFGLFGITNDNFPSKFMAALYNSLSRVSWSITVSWVIWACMNGYGSFINSFLSLDIWIPIGRLTYMCYLIHILVIQFIYSTADTTFNYTSISLSVQFVANMVLAYAFSFVFVLILESPILGIEKILIG